MTTGCCLRTKQKIKTVVENHPELVVQSNGFENVLQNFMGNA